MQSLGSTCDTGIQVVNHDLGPEVDGRGPEHQVFDRTVLPESREAHFQASFQPDGVPNHLSHGESDIQQKEKIQPYPWKKWRPWRRERSLREMSWLKLALAVSIGFALTSAVLAGIYARKSHRLSVLSGKPVSNCKDLESPYASLEGTHFDLFCGVDYPLNDLMSVWVHQFVDCIHACVSFNDKHQELGSNDTCKGVSYASDIPYGDMAFDHVAGNCFLKAIFPARPLADAWSRPKIDSAFFVNAGL